MSLLTSLPGDREIVVREPPSWKVVSGSACLDTRECTMTMYPNPFNASTTLRYTLSRPARVRMSVYDVLGRYVRTLMDEACPAGSHALMWDGTDEGGRTVASGVYLYRMEAGDYSAVRKMVVNR